jgi:2-methylisocitrate lyase-like PEP mutase family enzyme
MSVATKTTLNTLARTLKSLHSSSPPGPLILANVYDRDSTEALLSLNSSTSSPVKAIATASYAIALTHQIKDEELTMDLNLSSVISSISPAVKAAGLPLSIDLQDGYGESLVTAVRRSIDEAGAVGCNLEDSFRDVGLVGTESHCLRPIKEQQERIRALLSTAAECGVKDFVVNARTDIFMLEPPPDGAVERAVERGRAWLEAGATSVFILGNITKNQVERVVAGLGKGKVSMILSQGDEALTVRELAAIGVGRCSVGPSLYGPNGKYKLEDARRILAGGKLS